MVLAVVPVARRAVRAKSALTDRHCWTVERGPDGPRYYFEFFSMIAARPIQQTVAMASDASEAMSRQQPVSERIRLGRFERSGYRFA